MITLITCVNDFEEYKKNITINIDKIAIDNRENKYSAAQALNMGIEKTKNDIVVCCHQDVKFPDNWESMLLENLKKAERLSRGKVGVLGTAGVTSTGKKHGYLQDGNYGYWNEGGHKFGVVQTLDENCIIFKKSSGLRFDENFNHFHFYGADLCLQATDKGLMNFGINTPVIHLSGGGDSSMNDGRKIFEREMMKFKNKWIKRFSRIWTTTVVLFPHKEVILADYIKR